MIAPIATVVLAKPARVGRNDYRDHRHQRGDCGDTAAVAGKGHRTAGDHTSAPVAGHADFEQWKGVCRHKQDRGGGGEGEKLGVADRRKAPQARTAPPAQQPPTPRQIAAGTVNLAAVAAGEKNFGHLQSEGTVARSVANTRQPGSRSLGRRYQCD